MAILAVILSSAAANWVYESHVSTQLHDLRGGLCKIVVRSNKLSHENKAALLTTAARAAHRARLDAGDGHNALAQADRDSARLDAKFAREIQPVSLPGCPVP